MGQRRQAEGMPHLREGVRAKLPHAALLLQGMQAKRKESKEVKQQPMLTVEEVPTDSLIPYANNAKVHTNEQVGQIETSIKEFGFNDPVAVWDNPAGGIEIVEGHGRVLAAKNLGLETLPIIRLDHLTDEQRRAYTHVHNQLTLNTGWDFDVLDLELDELDFDFGEFGFDFEALASEQDFGEEFSLPDGDKPEMRTITFTLHENQLGFLNGALKEIDPEQYDNFGNQNKNGNKLYGLVKQWQASRR